MIYVFDIDPSQALELKKYLFIKTRPLLFPLTHWQCPEVIFIFAGDFIFKCDFLLEVIMFYI